MATFLIHRPDDETQVIKLKKETVSIGRRDDNDLVIDDVFVSRKHAELKKKGEGYVIKDCKSRYGTFVNGSTIDEAEVNYGDEIQVGNTMITFVDEERLNQIEMHKTPTRKVGAPLDLVKKIDEIKGRISNQDPHDTIIRSLNELQAAFTMYERKLGDVERSKEVASTLCEVGKIINFVFDLNVLLNLLMDLALKILQAKRGFIMLHDPAGQALHVKVARNMGGDLDSEKPVGISQTIAWEAFKTSQVVSTNDATKDERFMAQESVISYAIGSVICVPLVAKDRRTIGVMYLDNPVTQKPFSDSDVEFMQSFASQAAIAIENAQLYEKIKEEEKIRDRLQRFFSPTVVKKIMSEEGGLMLGGETRTATIMFCDIRGYTSLVEKIDSRVAVKILNDFLSSMTEEVFTHEGTLDKYIGDCVMAIFGAPVAHPDDPLRAVKAALGMKTRVQELKAQWNKELNVAEVETFDIGIGVHTGEVIAGAIGNIKRMEYTVVSPAVNLASRLESVAERGQIIISQVTYNQVRDHIEVNKLEPVKLKNISKAVQIYEITSLKRSV